MGEIRRLKRAWRRLGVAAQLQDIEGCKLPSVAAGRLRLLALESRRLSGRLRAMISAGDITGRAAEEAALLIACADEINARARSWPVLDTTTERLLPDWVSDLVPFATKPELRALLAPIHAAARRAGTPVRGPARALRIRRVSCVFSSRQHYDLVDARFGAARRWGGRECAFLMGLAAPELGPLRDPAYIYPAAKSADPDARLMGVACLAFVQSVIGNEMLKDVAMRDPEPGLRASALWAYRFAGGEWGRELASVMARHDPSEEVREFAAQVLEAEGARIWLL